LIRLLVGLGNPGKEYERTRHNAGFWLVERFASSSAVALRKDPKFQALVGRMAGGNAPAGAWLLLPQGFMNASGRAVQMLAGFFKIKPEEILVVHDELDFAPGIARIKQGGGIGGHNGLRDISQRIASHDYWRLRLGIGHPGNKDEVVDYVLHKPSADDRAAIEGAIDRALAVLPQCLAGDLQGAMQKLHSEEPKKAPEKKGSPDRQEPPGKAVPVKQPEQPVPEKAGGLLKSLFGRK
jgi:PTH1 family peptidyl-tRNA hydrolase